MGPSCSTPPYTAAGEAEVAVEAEAGADVNAPAAKEPLAPLPAAKEPAKGQATEAPPASQAPAGSAPEAPPATSLWKCSWCGGSGWEICGTTEREISCSRCNGTASWTGETITLKTAASFLVSDISALRFVLREPRPQAELDEALEMCEPVEKVPVLVEAGADVQAGFQKYARCILTLWLNNGHLSSKVKKFQVFVDSGATVGDEELKLLEAAFETCSGEGPSWGWRVRARPVLASIQDIFTSAQTKKVLNVYIEEASGDSWTVAVHSVGGDLVVTLRDVAPSLTIRELKEKIKAQTSIPCGCQSLVLGRRKIDMQETLLSKSLREVLSQ